MPAVKGAEVYKQKVKTFKLRLVYSQHAMI